MSVADSNVDYQKPKGYDSSRDAPNMDSFLWQMEMYSDGVNIVEEVMMVWKL